MYISIVNWQIVALYIHEVQGYGMIYEYNEKQLNQPN